MTKQGAATDWLGDLIANPPATDDCVIWPYSGAGRSNNLHAAFKGTTVSRILLGLVKGDGVVARHTCDNGMCVNVKHLIPGTPAENRQDMIDRGRHRSGSVR